MFAKSWKNITCLIAGQREIKLAQHSGYLLCCLKPQMQFSVIISQIFLVLYSLYSQHPRKGVIPCPLEAASTTATGYAQWGSSCFFQLLLEIANVTVLQISLQAAQEFGTSPAPPLPQMLRKLCTRAAIPHKTLHNTTQQHNTTQHHFHFLMFSEN